jgi:ABC-type multidrug transport system fused ATPase/permease subunit
MKYIVWIWRNMAGIRWNTLVRIVVGITQVMLGLIMIWLSKQFIDVTIRTGTTDDIIRMVAMLLATVVAGILLRQLFYYMTTKAATYQSNTIRLRVFSSLFRRQMFEDQLHSGDVTSRLSKDIDTVANVTTTLLPQFTVTGVQLTGAFLLMYSMDSRLAIVLLFITPLVVGFGKMFAHKLRDMTLEIRQQESFIQMQVQEGMEHNAVLRSLGSEQWVTDRLSGQQDQLMGRVLRRTRFTVVSRLLLGLTFSLGYLLAFVWGGLQLRSGVITFGVMTSFLQLVGQIQHPILSLLNMLPHFFYASASIDRLEELEQSASHPSQLSHSPWEGAGVRSMPVVSLSSNSITRVL